MQPHNKHTNELLLVHIYARRKHMQIDVQWRNGEAGKQKQCVRHFHALLHSNQRFISTKWHTVQRSAGENAMDTC